MRTRDQLRADFAACGEDDYLAWLRRQPEGDPGGQIVTVTAGQTQSAEFAASPEWTPDQPSRGLGDTVAKITRATGLDRLAHAYTRVTGRDCGCGRRQTELNRRFPRRS